MRPFQTPPQCERVVRSCKMRSCHSTVPIHWPDQRGGRCCRCRGRASRAGLIGASPADMLSSGESMQLVMQYSLGRGLTHDQMLCGWPRARAHEAGGAAGVSAAHGQWPRAGGHQGSRRELSQPRVRHLLIRTLTPRQRLAWCTAQHTRAADSGHQHPRGPDQQRAGDTSYKRSRRQVLFEASWTWSGRRHSPRAASAR